MLPGPDQIIACPQCGYLARQPTLASGNTYHAVLWSDGKMDAPMLPEYPDITRCRGCRTVHWIRDAKVMGEIGPWRDAIEDAPEEWKTAERVDWPGLDEYADALESAAANGRKDERFLRIRFWWLINDPLRDELSDESLDPRQNRKRKPSIPKKHASRSEANLKRLAKLLDARNPQQRIMKAEIARQMGMFDVAIPLLEKCPSSFRGYAEQILVFTKNGDRTVHQLIE